MGCLLYWLGQDLLYEWYPGVSFFKNNLGSDSFNFIEKMLFAPRIDVPVKSISNSSSFFAPPWDKLSSDNILSELSSSESDRRLNGLSSSDNKLGDFLLLFFVDVDFFLISISSSDSSSDSSSLSSSNNISSSLS